MRFQLLLVGLATVVCFALGASRWRAQILSSHTFSSAERKGGWVLVTGDYSGIRATSRGDGTERIRGFENVNANQGWDVSEDFRRVALIDAYSYSGSPGLKVYAAHRATPIAETAPASGNTFYCPLFDADGSLLFLDATGYTNMRLRRLKVPATDGAAATSRVYEVMLASTIEHGDCPERSDDGELLAWVGSGGQVHLARRSSGGYLADHKKFPGTEFALSPDGASLAIRDGTGISIVDVTSGAKRLLTADATYGTLVDFSPDGQWLASVTNSALSGRGVTAIRTSDAAVVSIPMGRTAYLYPQPGVTAARWIARD